MYVLSCKIFPCRLTHWSCASLIFFRMSLGFSKLAFVSSFLLWQNIAPSIRTLSFICLLKLSSSCVVLFPSLRISVFSSFISASDTCGCLSYTFSMFFSSCGFFYNDGVVICIRLDFYLLGKGGYVFGSVGLSVCLFVCLWTTLLKKL